MKKVHEKILIDSKHAHLLKKYTFCLDGNGYPMTNIGKKKVTLHSMIMEKRQGFETDHINRNKFDNRLINLRYVTRSQNCQNRSMFKCNTSGYRGVSWHKPSQKWQVRIRLNRKLIALGSFTDIEDAAKAYKNKAVELFEKYLGEIK